jgi:hypothetical protein
MHWPGQGWLHPPQFCGSVLVSTQPDGQHVSGDWQGGAPLHVPPSMPIGGMHVLAWHVSPGGQGWLHPPQLFGSVVVSVQPSAQHWRVPVHAGPPLQVTHDPPAQVTPGGHGWLHPPQLFGSVSVSVQPEAQHWSTPVHTGPP